MTVDQMRHRPCPMCGYDECWWSAPDEDGVTEYDCVLPSRLTRDPPVSFRARLRHPITGRFMAGDCERDCLEHCAELCGVGEDQCPVCGGSGHLSPGPRDYGRECPWCEGTGCR